MRRNLVVICTPALTLVFTFACFEKREAELIMRIDSSADI